VELRLLTQADHAAVVRLWHAAKQDAYGFLATERGRTLDNDDLVLRQHILPRCAIWLAVDGDEPLGFLALAGSYVDRLYVAPAAQRRGVGAALFAQARVLSPCGLELHTHQENAGARAFYERQGCVAVSFGVSTPPESAPDVEYHWRPAPGEGA